VLYKNKWSDEGRKEIRRAAAIFKVSYTKIYLQISFLCMYQKHMKKIFRQI